MKTELSYYLEDLPFGSQNRPATSQWVKKLVPLITDYNDLFTFNEALRTKLMQNIRPLLETIQSTTDTKALLDSFQQNKRYRSLTGDLVQGTGSCRTSAFAAYGLALNFAHDVAILSLENDRIRRGGHALCVFRTEEGIGSCGVNSFDIHPPSSQFASYADLASKTALRYYENSDEDNWPVYRLHEFSPIAYVGKFMPGLVRKIPTQIKQRTALFSQAHLKPHLSSFEEGYSMSTPTDIEIQLAKINKLLEETNQKPVSKK